MPFSDKKRLGLAKIIGHEIQYGEKKCPHFSLWTYSHLKSLCGAQDALFQDVSSLCSMFRLFKKDR